MAPRGAAGWPQSASAGATRSAATATIRYLRSEFLENQRNMILAIVLSAIVLFGWSALSNRRLTTGGRRDVLSLHMP